MQKNGVIGFLGKRKDVIASFLLCFTALVIALILHPAYETNDDAYMEALLFGYQGMGNTSYLIFMNRLMGCILYFLVSVFPHLNWYFVMHYSVCLLSLYVLARTFIRKNGFVGFFASLLVLAAAIEALIIVQFTKTAALASVAGMTGLLFSLRTKKEKLFKVICIGIILAGSMIRFKAFVMVSPFIFIIFLHELRMILKNRKQDLKRFLTVTGLTLILAGSVFAAGIIVDRMTPGVAEYTRYNDSRAPFTDYSTDSSVRQDADAMMVVYWMNNDPEVFTVEKMEQLNAKFHKKTDYFSPKILTSYFRDYLPQALISEPLLLAVFAGCLLYLLFSKRKIYVVTLLGFYFILEWYLFSVGRNAVHRVDFGILLSFMTALLYLGDVSLPKISESLRKIIRYGVVPVLAIIGVVMIGTYPFSWHVTDREYFREVGESLKAATSDSDCQYMVHPLALGLNKERNIYDLPADYNDGFFYMGGWQEGIGIPGIGYSKHCDIEGNPWETCVDNSSVKLVFLAGEDDKCIKAVEAYIEKEYGRTVTDIREFQDDNIVVYRIVSV